MKDCSICLEEISDRENKILDCTHSFHISCINTWIETHTYYFNCPLCQKVHHVIEIPTQMVLSYEPPRLNCDQITNTILAVGAFLLLSYITFNTIK